MSVLVDESQLPQELTPEQAVEAAYAGDLAAVPSDLRRGLPVLFECGKDLLPSRPTLTRNSTSSMVTAMNVTLPLSPESQAELERRAAASGSDVAAYVLRAVQQQLEFDANGSAPGAVDYDQWRREFRAWIASHPSRNPSFDDSRESIYD